MHVDKTQGKRMLQYFSPWCDENHDINVDLIKF